MRIFVDCHNFDEGGQGVVTYIYNLYSGIGLHSENIKIYLAANNINYLKKYFNNQKYYYLKYPLKNKYIRLLVFIPFFQLKYKIDVSHFQYYVPLIKIGKWVVTIHDVLFLEFPSLFPLIYRLKNRFFFLLSIIRADIILTVSNYSKEKIIKYFSLKKEIFVIPNCVDCREIKTIVKKKNLPQRKRKFILFVGRIEKRKNHIFLCESYIQSKLYIDYDLIFIGRDDLSSDNFFKYLETIDPDIRKGILIYTNISDGDLKWFYLYASLFVFPSLCEGFGIPPLEAASFHCSTICSNTTAMRDFDFFGDRLFDPKNKEEIIQKMLKYIDNKTGMKLIECKIKQIYNKDSICESYKKLLSDKFI
jgi:glycosyltransferase involved in cell wall biosynthesis